MQKSMMHKSITLAAAALALAGAALLLPLRGHEAAAQSPNSYIVNAINLDIAPDQFDKFMEIAKENAVASAKDPGCREFNIAVAENDPHHVMFFEVYENAAALDYHRTTEHFKKFQAETKDMAIKRDVRRFTGVSMNFKGA